MCQLLGMNCNVPTDICFSFEGFHVRGGATDSHRDGWGIAFFENAGYRLFIDTKPSVSSPVAELVRQYPIRSKNVVAHIRKATVGAITLENTHPFVRELWGQYWIFAHNGNLSRTQWPSGGYRPVGTTDSEAAFCHILNELSGANAASHVELADLAHQLKALTREISATGTFNFLLSNGQYMFAHCSTQLCYITRQAPFAEAHLIDRDIAIDFREVTTPDDRVTVIATSPLTDNEIWTPLTADQLAVFHEGRLWDIL